jgi:hypothetical protein
MKSMRLDMKKSSGITATKNDHNKNGKRTKFKSQFGDLNLEARGDGSKRAKERFRTVTVRNGDRCVITPVTVLAGKFLCHLYTVVTCPQGATEPNM